MIITGRFIHDAPYFPANVVVGDWHGVVWLLADVGASHTAFLDRDLKILNVSSSALEIVSKRLIGIGGSVRTFLLRNIQMTFISDKGDFRLIRDIYAIQHDLERISLDEAELLYTLPSVLGRDVINQFEFCCDYEAGTVSLKRP